LVERGVVRVRQIAVKIPLKRWAWLDRSIKQTVLRVLEDGWVFCEPKTENGVRDVYFPVRLYRLLERYRARQQEWRRQAGSLWRLLRDERDVLPLQPRQFRRTQARQQIEQIGQVVETLGRHLDEPQRRRQAERTLGAGLAAQARHGDG